MLGQYHLCTAKVGAAPLCTHKVGTVLLCTAKVGHYPYALLKSGQPPYVLLKLGQYPFCTAKVGAAPLCTHKVGTVPLICFVACRISPDVSSCMDGQSPYVPSSLLQQVLPPKLLCFTCEPGPTNKRSKQISCKR